MKQYLLPLIYESIRIKSLTLNEASNNSLITLGKTKDGYNYILNK